MNAHRIVDSLPAWIVIVMVMLTISGLCLAATLQEGARIVSQNSVGRLSADVRVERGLVLSGHPFSHLISLQKWQLVGLPPLSTISNTEKFKLAIREFKMAIASSGDLEGYTLSQIQGFLGRAQMLLGSEMLSLSERSSDRNKKRAFKAKAHSCFEESILHYRRALKGAPESFRYYLAEDLVRAVVASGNLNRALEVISDFEQKKMTPNPGIDHGLLRMKAEIYWITGRYSEAGATYEEWIRRGNAEAQLSSGSLIRERLLYLKKTTGHPANLPSNTTSK